MTTMALIPVLAAVAALATFSGGQVTTDDLRALAFLDRIQKVDEHLPEAIAAPARGSDEFTSAVRVMAHRRIAAAEARARGLRRSDAENAIAEIRRLAVLRKVFYLENTTHRVQEARADWHRMLERAHAANPDLCEVPGVYHFRYIFIGDPATTPTRWAELESSATRVRRMLDEPGTDFGATARRFCNSLPADNRGALVGPLGSRGIETTRVEVLESLAVGGVSDPFRTNRGYMILKLEQRQPRRMMTPEESSETLVLGGRLERFMPELVDAVVTSETVAANPFRIIDGALSPEPADGDKVVVESRLFTLRNRDIYTPAWRAANPEAEWKDIHAAARLTAARHTLAELARRDYLTRQPVYQHALDMVEEMADAAAALRQGPELRDIDAVLAGRAFAPAD